MIAAMSEDIIFKCNSFYCRGGDRPDEFIIMPFSIQCTNCNAEYTLEEVEAYFEEQAEKDIVEKTDREKELTILEKKTIWNALINYKAVHTKVYFDNQDKPEYSRIINLIARFDPSDG